MSLTAMSVILFQIALTRVFAVMMWHHFAYMVVSLALLGFGASGSILTAQREAEREDSPAGRLATYATLYGIAVVLAFCYVTLIRIDTLHIWEDPANFVALLFCYMVISAPFLLGGLAIGTALTRFPGQIGKLYFVDLAGSAVGGALAGLLLGALGSTVTVVAAGTLGLLGGLTFAWGAGTGRRILHGSALVLGIYVLVGFLGGIGSKDAPIVPAMRWSIPFAPGKDIAKFPGGTSAATLHSAVAQVDVSEPLSVGMIMGGEFGDVDRLAPPGRGVLQDGTAPTALYARSNDIAAFPCLDDSQAGSAYTALNARGASIERALVIGVGGGVDVMMALYNGAKQVTGVEINRAMIRMVTEDYADEIGPLFDDERVDLVNEDGRAFLRRHDTKYDVIQMSGVDTYTALATGAYTLSESYLYTVEAVKDFYEHLEDGGIVNYSRFLLRHPFKPRESIRLANVAREALAQIGIEQPSSQICVLLAQGWASTMIKRGPFTRVEVDALRAFCRKQNFMGLVYDPLRPAGGPYDRGALQDAAYRTHARNAMSAVLAGLPPAVRAPIEAPAREALATVLRTALSQGLPASDALLDDAMQAVPAAHRTSIATRMLQERDRILAGVNTSFDDFENTQGLYETLLRSDDAGRAQFLAEYPYNLEPATDDRPFFFDYYKWGQVFQGGETWGRGFSEYHADFPVGHVVLLGSMAQILVLAVFMILAPLAKLRDPKRPPVSGRFRYFLYFTALGVGFMFIEICLMQKLVLFLGHPTYALSVVLAGILIFSGLGALFTQRIARASRGVLLLLLLGILAVVAMDVFWLPLALEALLGEALFVRIAATFLLLAPTGFVLGMPFPLGIRILKSRAPVLIPWGWAVNGFLSVFSSLLAIVVAMVLGFTWVLALAGGVYALGLLFMATERADEAAPT